MKVTRTTSMLDRAEQILQRFAAEGDEGVIRGNVLIELGGPVARRTLPARRLWAEAWQLLERGGLICREPDPGNRDYWFLTGAGRQAFNGGDVGGSLQLAGVSW